MKPARTEADEIADWACTSELIDGVVFVAPDPRRPEGPVCAVAVARGVSGYGKGWSQAEALVSAVGEAVERWAASHVESARLTRASYFELGDAAFDPRWLCLYSDDQYAIPGFPFCPFDGDRSLDWVAGHWLDTGELVYLPAFAIYLTSEFQADALCQMTSNGLAAGTTVCDASERAVLELYERDAFLCSWFALCGAELIDVREGREIYLLESLDEVFVAACVEPGDGVTLGLGAARDSGQAIEKALVEHAQTAPYLTRRAKEAPVSIVNTPEDAGVYYCDPAHRAEFDRWRLSARESVPPTDAGTVRIAVADLTPHHLQNSPFRVVRALGRGLQPVECGSAFHRQPTPRLAALLDGRTPNSAPPPIC